MYQIMLAGVFLLSFAQADAETSSDTVQEAHGYDLIAQAPKKRGDMNAPDVTLADIQENIAYYGSEQTYSDLLQVYYTHPDQNIMCFREILSEQIGKLQSFATYLERYYKDTYLKDVTDIDQAFMAIRDIKEKTSQLFRSLPTPISLETLVRASAVAKVYRQALETLIQSNFSHIPDVQTIPDTPSETPEYVIHSIVRDIAEPLSLLEYDVYRIHLTWYNKLYRAGCSCINALPKKELLYTVSGIGIAGLISLKYMSDDTCRKLGLGSLKKLLYGPDYSSDYIQNIQQAAHNFADANGYAQLNANDQDVRQRAAEIAMTAKQEGRSIQEILNRELSGEYMFPIAWKGELHKLVNASGIMALSSIAYGIYKFQKDVESIPDYIKEKLYNLHNRLRGEGPHRLNGFQYEDTLSLDDPRLEPLPIKYLHDIVTFMENPRSGNNVEKNIVLTGPPGCGKTFAARGLAGSLSNACFWDLDKVDCDIFNKLSLANAAKYIVDCAREQAPCVLFIDELQTYQLQDDKNATFLNELLKELDRNNENQDPEKQIFIIAATNKPEQLSEALLRHGRFTQINLSYPNYEQRKTLFEAICKDLALDTNCVDFDYLAKITKDTAISGLERVCKRAQFLSQTQNKPATTVDFYRAINDIIRQITPKCPLSQYEQNIIAVNCAAQSLIQYLYDPTTFDAVTICPVMQDIKEVGTFDGTQEQRQTTSCLRSKHTQHGNIFTISLCEELSDMSSQSHDHRCRKLLAGKIGEELITGGRSSYSWSDLEHAFEEAKALACDGVPLEKLSEHRQNDILDRAYQIYQGIYEEVLQTLSQHSNELTQLRDALLQEYFIHWPYLDTICASGAEDNTT